MLAFVQRHQHQQRQPPPSSPPPPPPDLFTRTMSLAVLPSSPAPYTSPHDFPATSPSPSPSPSPSKRPKLSLDTSSVAPTAFGKKATSLRLETLSATSPTVRNTFSNAHDQRAARSRLTPIATTLSTSPEAATPAQLDVPVLDSSARSISSSGSISSVSTIDSSIQEVPYKLPFNHSSILKNGPLERRATQTTSFAQSKPMFPSAKKVGFRAPLTEEVKTTKYTLKHSDIESSSSTISTLDLNDTAKVDGRRPSVEDHRESKGTDTGDVASPQTGDKRESSDEEDEEGQDGESYPTTPVAGRRKRHRQWRWTLEPVGVEQSSGDDPGHEALEEGKAS